jgi:hypothetical protein
MITGTDTASNEATLMDFRSLLRQWRTNGLSPNDTLARLLRENATRGRPVADADVVRMVQEAGDQSAPVQETQGVRRCCTETQENQKLRTPTETQRNSPNCNEKDRGGKPPETNQPTGSGKQEGRRATFTREYAAGVPSTLAFGDYLACAVDAFRDRRCQDPHKDWQGIFYLVQLVKGHPSTATIGAKMAFQRTDGVIRAWHKEGWEVYLGVTREDAGATFFDAWDKIRYFPGRTPLGNALEQSERMPLLLDKETRVRRPDGYERFVSLAGWLQVGMGDWPIMLPYREVDELLDVQPMTVSRYRKWAKEVGFLTEVKAAKFTGKRGEGEATEFRFDTSRWECLRERAE